MAFPPRHFNGYTKMALIFLNALSVGSPTGRCYGISIDLYFILFPSLPDRFRDSTLK